jgi:uncharacterized protein (DUF433 family)
MATPTTTLRLRPHLRAEIERMARRARRSFSEVTQDLLEEAVRMRECPGVHFAEEPAGREAKVTGSGLGVWEVISTYKGVMGDAKKLGKWHPHLSAGQVRAALTYYDRYPGEIDAAIAENVAAFKAGKAEQARSRRRSLRRT